jgi:hypothetical protein
LRHVVLVEFLKLNICGFKACRRCEVEAQVAYGRHPLHQCDPAKSEREDPAPAIAGAARRRQRPQRNSRSGRPRAAVNASECSPTLLISNGALDRTQIYTCNLSFTIRVLRRVSQKSAFMIHAGWVLGRIPTEYICSLARSHFKPYPCTVAHQLKIARRQKKS